jgi:hypothetical protein
MGVLTSIKNLKKLTILMAGFLWLMALSMPVRAQDSEPGALFRQKIEAGLIYNFLKYTTWPDPRLASGGASLRVCLFGGDAFDGYLNPLQGRTAQQYVIDIAKIDTLSGLEGCHLVFIHRDREDMLGEIIVYARSHGILTVSDIARFIQKGGMVEFATRDDQRIHLFINKKLIDAAGINIQDRLVRLAEAGTG